MSVNQPNSSLAPIGVFDSGVGGLTVLRALKARFPNEDFIYLGDTARLPYGTKSAESIVRYSVQAARQLVAHRIKCLVVACNTASSVAIDRLRAEFAPLPVIGVVEPGADAVCRVSKSGHIAVIATDGTVRGDAYQRAIRFRRPEARIEARACPLFVALAEEGLIGGPIATAIAHHYLDVLFKSSNSPDALVLGCTHFPVLTEVLRDVIGNGVTIVDSAETTAIALGEILEARNLVRPFRSNTATLSLLATDSAERFARVGSIFLGQRLDVSDIIVVDLV